MSEIIHIYHTNDLHSHFTHWPRIQTLLTERREWHEEAGDACLVLDIGDHADRSHPFTEGTAGKGNVQLLNEAGYDAVTIGNNEGITLSKAELDELYDQADFSVVVANLMDLDGNQPTWASPNHIIETKNGTKIGLIAATAEFTPFYRRLGWQVTGGREAIKREAAEIRGSVDFLICMSHLGIREDELLAEECPEVDIILGAHTHHLFHQGKEIGGTLLGAAGKFGYYVGHIEIDIATRKMTAEVIETEQLPEADEGFNEYLVGVGKQQMSETVFYNERAMKAEWFKPSAMAELFGDALVTFASADCGLFNAGIFMEDMAQGEMTRYDFHRMLPHPINPCVIDLSGAELKEIYLQSLNEDWPQLELKGMGFRGAVFGRMIHSGMDMHNHQLMVGGEPADPDRIYRLATLDLFTFGYFFPALKRAPKSYFMPEFLRDVFSDYFRMKTVK